jgi:hypothetical protein
VTLPETIEQDEAPLQVRGRALRVALGVTFVLQAAGLWAARSDLESTERYPSGLDLLAPMYKYLIVVGLLAVGWRIGSASFKLLALLVAALAAGSLIVNNYENQLKFYDSLAPIADRLPVSSGFLGNAMIFLTLAAVGGGLVLLAYRKAGTADRHQVLVVIGLLFLVGVFVGPVNAISAATESSAWSFAEDFGQVVTLAILAGHVAGLVVATWDERRRTRPTV